MINNKTNWCVVVVCVHLPFKPNVFLCCGCFFKNATLFPCCPRHVVFTDGENVIPVRYPVL